MSPRVASRRPDLIIAVALFAGICLVLAPLQRGTTPTYDSSIYMDVASNLVDHGSLKVRNVSTTADCTTAGCVPSNKARSGCLIA